MSLEDLLGFIISFGAFVFLILRSVFSQKKGYDEEEEELVIPPLPRLLKQKIAKPRPAKPRAMVSRHYDDVDPNYAKALDGPSRANTLISHLKSKKDMVILREIMGPPKGLR